MNNRILKFVLFLMAAAFPGLSNAAAQSASADKTLSPFFFVRGDPGVDRLPLKDTMVDVAVSGVITEVSVVQTYKNEGSRPINASYIFPASTRAAVYGMRMKIRDEIIYAKIKEREQAREDFEKAKKDGKSASLLEQDRPNVFAMSVANIMPGDDVRIELSYTELLVPTDGDYEFVYPTVIGPRYSSDKESEAGDHDKFVKTPYQHEGRPPASTLHISTRVAAGLPIQSLDCPSHRIKPQLLNASTATLVLDEPDAFQGNRDFILRYRLAGSQIQSGLMLFKGGDENFFLYMAEPPARVNVSEVPPREYVFVVDVSGSMEGFPLKTAKELLTNLIGGLRSNDYFNVVLFAGDSAVLSETAVQANKENVAHAIDLIDHQRGGGGTELLGGIQRAMGLKHQAGVSRSIVLVTDGYVSAERGVFDEIRNNLDNTNVFAFGIGTSVNRYLIEGVARAGMGEPFVVESEKEAEETAERFRTYIESPVLTDVKVKADGFDIYDVQPAHFPDMFAQRPIVLFGKWRGEATGQFVLTGQSGVGEFTTALDVAGVRPDEGNRALRYLWARSRIAELSDFGDGELPRNRIREITDLGLKYNLLTQYTSFIAVREKLVNPKGAADDVDQPLPLPVGVMDTAVGSEPELWCLLGALVAAGTLYALRARIRPIDVILKWAE